MRAKLTAIQGPRWVAIACALLVIGTAESADNSVKQFSYKSTDIKAGLTLLSGAGGNIAVLQSDNGVLVVDNGLERNNEALQAALEQFDGRAKYVLNTHWHGDHTGGNRALSEQATILAHENVRLRLAGQDNDDADKSVADAFPDITYDDGITLHFGGQTVRVVHFPGGHTDGDSVVYFEPAHVVHLGDLMFADYFPYVDVDSGGSVTGYINNVAAIEAQLDDEHIVIPGHGQITDKQGVRRFHQMMIETTTAIAEMKSAGQSLQQIQQQGLGDKWQGWGDFFIDESRWISIVYNDL
ncbi:MAG: MBL fold metallo-hydrolase [Arenicella sp.]|nr:MBL fold metallo-hydrolase [Arenicella sp.]